MPLSTSGTRAGNIQLTSGGQLRLRNDATTIGSKSALLTVGTLYRVGLRQSAGGGSGVLEGYLAVGDAPFGAPFASSSAQTIGGAAT